MGACYTNKKAHTHTSTDTTHLVHTAHIVSTCSTKKEEKTQKDGKNTKFSVIRSSLILIFFHPAAAVAAKQCWFSMLFTLFVWEFFYLFAFLSMSTLRNA